MLKTTTSKSDGQLRTMYDVRGEESEEKGAFVTKPVDSRWRSDKEPLTMCRCHRSKITKVSVGCESHGGEVVICDDHGVVYERYSGAATSPADFCRRATSRKVFMAMAVDWCAQLESVLTGELFTLENEMIAETNLGVVKERFRALAKLADRLDFEGSAGKQPQA